MTTQVPTDLGFSPRVRVPVVFERAADVTTIITLDLGGTPVAPTEAKSTYTLLSPTGAAIVDAEAVTVVGNDATYGITGAVLAATLAYGQGYREVWNLVVNGINRPVPRPAILAKYPLLCPLTQGDLTGIYPNLDSMLRAGATDLQRFIDEAWGDILRRLLQDGRWTDAVVDVDSLYMPMRERTFFYYFRYIAASNPSDGTFKELYLEHEQAYFREWGGVRFKTDLGQDGVADSEDRRGAATIIRRSVGPEYGYRRRSGRRRVI